MRLFKSLLVFISLVLINIGQAYAQSTEALEAMEAPKTEKPFRIGIGFGYSFLGYREETDLPANRKLDTINFNINGNIEKNGFLYLLNFGILSGETGSPETESDERLSNFLGKSSFLRMYFENALDYRLWGNSVFPGYLGGAIRGDIYYSVLKQSHYYSLTMLCSLDLHITQKWIINAENNLIFSVSIPFFGYAFRPPYYGLLFAPFDLEERVTSIHNYRAVFGDLKYFYKPKDLFSFYLGLGFELSQITFPQQRKDASLSINAGISFYF